MNGKMPRNTMSPGAMTLASRNMMAASPSVCAVGTWNDNGLLTVDMKRHLVGERDDGQGPGTRVELRVVQHALAHVVVSDNNGARSRPALIAADMVAVHVRVDDEVDRPPGEFLGLGHEGVAAAAQRVVDHHDVFVTDQQADAAALVVARMIDARRDFSMLEWVRRLLRHANWRRAKHRATAFSSLSPDIGTAIVAQNCPIGDPGTRTAPSRGRHLTASAA